MFHFQKNTTKNEQKTTKKDGGNAEMAPNLTKWLSYVMYILINNQNQNQLAMFNIQIIPSKPVIDENETMEKPLASIDTLQIEATLGTVFYSL